jgi:hypothetical protein
MFLSDKKLQLTVWKLIKETKNTKTRFDGVEREKEIEVEGLYEMDDFKFNISLR